MLGGDYKSDLKYSRIFSALHKTLSHKRRLRASGYI
jgi:hypothetical protein